MITPPDADLRTTLHRLADSTTPLPVDDGLWQRGQASRRRAQAFGVAAVLALVVSVGGIATVLTTTDREARTASSEVVEGGAIPSRIEDPDGLTATTDLAVGRASVAFVDSASDVVVVSASTGRYHALDLEEAPLRGPVQLSPDGRLLAYAYTAPSQAVEGAVEAGTAIVDLGTGAVRRMAAVGGRDLPVAVSTLSWSADSSLVAWWGRENRSPTAAVTALGTSGALGMIRARTGEQSTLGRLTGGDTTTAAISVNDNGWITLATPGRVSSWVVEGDGDGGGSSVPLVQDLPGGGPGTSATRQPVGRLTAIGTSSPTRAAPFVNDEGEVFRRIFARDLYPNGAAVTPVGWATDTLLLAQVDSPGGSYVEGRHLALLTSPDRPESEWTYRILVKDVPTAPSLSVAVDLIPDLDGTSSQQFTHDFGDVLAPDQRDISWMIGLGVAVAVAVLMGLRWLWRRSA